MAMRAYGRSVGRVVTALGICCALLAACAEVTGPPLITIAGPTAAIVDAAHGGNAHFFFQPPIAPMRAYAGQFDAAAEPVVEVCALEEDRCDLVIARFTTVGWGGGAVRVDPTTEQYIVNWRTSSPRLRNGSVYRLRVLVRESVIGYVDVVPVPSARDARSVDATRYVALVNGQTVPVKFRIEVGAVASATGTVPAAGGTVQLSDMARVVFPAGAFSAGRSVTLSLPSTDQIDADYRATIPFLHAPRVPWALIVDVGGTAPAALPTVDLRVPADFLAAMPAEHEASLWVQLYQDAGEDLLDGFVRLPASFDGTWLHAELPDGSFTNQRGASGTWKAIVVVVAAPVGLHAAAATARRGASLAGSDPACPADGLQPPLVTAEVTDPFGGRHRGVDYDAPGGQQVLAPAAGTIERIGWDVRALSSPDPRGYPVKGWGRYVRLRLDDGSAVLLAHLAEHSTDQLAEGQRAAPGEVIGQVGNTGGSTRSHLHMEQRTADGTLVDPQACMASASVGDLTGQWVGILTGAVTGSSQYQLDLVQSGGSLSGQVVLPQLNASAPLTGTVSGNTLTLRVTWAATGCLNVGTGTVAGDAMTLSLFLECQGASFPFGGVLERVVDPLPGAAAGLPAVRRSPAPLEPGAYHLDGSR